MDQELSTLYPIYNLTLYTDEYTDKYTDLIYVMSYLVIWKSQYDKTIKNF